MKDSGARDARQAFVDRVKEIDPMFKRGDFRAFWLALRELVALAPERRDVSQKKSHYLASLAARSLARGDPAAALVFLDYAEVMLDPSHLTPFLIAERQELRRQTQAEIETRTPAKS